MGVKVTFDTDNRLMIVTEAPILAAGETVAKQTLDIEVDFYSDAKEDWEANVGGNFRKNKFPFITAQSAGQSLPGGQVEPAFFRLRNEEGWRILPYDSDHELTLIGNIVPNDENLPILAPRTGRSILIFRDGSQVAQMTSNTVIEAVSQVPELLDIHGQVSRSVFIDTELVTNGNGYQQTPFNNWTDAVDYAEANGLKRIILLADAVADRQLKNFVITGVGTPHLDFNGQDMDKSEFNRLTLSGTHLGTVVVQESNITGTDTTINGFYENCAMGSTFKVPDGGVAFIKNSSAFIIGQVPPVFDVGGVAGTGVLIMSGWEGGATVKNVNQATDDVKFINNAARIILDGASCTDGTINVIGVARLIKNGATSTIIEETVDPTNLRESWTRLGLNKENPFTDNTNQFISALGDIVIDITGDGVTTTTQTRQ